MHFPFITIPVFLLNNTLFSLMSLFHIMVFNNVDMATRYNEAQQTSLQLLMKDAEISND